MRVDRLLFLASSLAILVLASPAYATPMLEDRQASTNTTSLSSASASASTAAAESGGGYPAGVGTGSSGSGDGASGQNTGNAANVQFGAPVTLGSVVVVVGAWVVMML